MNFTVYANAKKLEWSCDFGWYRGNSEIPLVSIKLFNYCPEINSFYFIDLAFFKFVVIIGVCWEKE